MLKKTEMIVNQSIVRLTCLAERDNNLVYFYEYIPHSIDSYLRQKKETQAA